jgi:acyl-CoA dehydrogenase
MKIEIDEETQKAVELVRFLGKTYLRPLGLEADKLERPIPADAELYQIVAKSGYMSQGVGSGDGKKSESNYRLTTVRSVLVAEEGSYWDRGAMVSLPGPGLGGPPVQRMGTDAQKERFLSIFRQKEKPVWAAFAMTEPGAGSDVARIKTRATKDGSQWILNGQKMYSSNSPRAEWVVVFATIDPELGRNGHRAFIVEKGTPGFEILRIEKKMGLRAYETASFALDNVILDDDHLLGGEAYYLQSKSGFKGAMESFNATRPIIAAMANGIARAACDRAKEFIKEIPEHAFNRKRRAIDQLVEAQSRLNFSRFLTLKAAWMADRKLPNEIMASAAKQYSGKNCVLAIQFARDVLGEAGLTWDNLIEKLARDVKAMDIVEGTQQVQRRIIAKNLIGAI